MKELFGIPMNTIMLATAGMFAVALVSVLAIFITSRHMFKMGLRNIPRRGLQSGLVIVGLMLATLITTAAFTTGDTVDYSIARASYDQLQRTDLQLNFVGEDDIFTDAVSVYINEDVTSGLEKRFAGDQDIDGFIPLLLEPVGALDLRTGQSEASITLAGIEPQRLERLGGLRLAHGGKPDLSALGFNDILLSEKAADKLNAKTGDMISLFVNGLATDVTVRGIVKDELASSGTRQFYEKGSGGGAMLLPSVQRITSHAGKINRLNIALKGDLGKTYAGRDGAGERLQSFLKSNEGRALLSTDNPVTVDPIKADAIEEAEETSNLFTTFFLVLGLFSIAAGIMLIFMIFVMLAAERKPEMGMARAVGAQRSSLVQAFIAEGMVYSVVAGAVGAAVGVAAAVGLVVGFLSLAGGFDFLHAHVTARSLIISYCLGVVVTFLTVVFSSLKVSSVNIVAAIRGTEEDDRREVRRRINWRWVLIGIPALVIPPLGLWFLLRKGFGLPWAWIIAPIGIALSLVAIWAANQTDMEFLFSFGVSVLPLCLAMIAAYYRAPSRLTWTLVGFYLAAYWLAPVDYADLILGKSLKGDIEMFVLSGVMVVIASTLVIVHNAPLLTVLFQSAGKPGSFRYGTAAALGLLNAGAFAGAFLLGDNGDGLGQLLYLFGGVIAIATATAFAAVRFPHLAPALKMAIAYPLSNRFRTGMTIAMFSLIIFSLATFSALNASFVSLLKADGGDGGWDVITTANRTSALTDVRSALDNTRAPVASDVAATGRTTIFTGQSQVRVPGDEYKVFPVLAADDGFFSMPSGRLQSWARGYDNERAVFDAVRTGVSMAIVDPSVLPNGFSEYEFNVKDLKVEDDRFDAFELEYKDIASNREGHVLVVGVLAIQIDPGYTAGIYVNNDTYARTFGPPSYLRTYVKLNDKVNAKKAANAIEAALVTQGVQAESIQDLLDESVAQNNSFIRMFQGFMALGLFTGIAALGVIAYRSVVERRQQIGMLRAIGYQASTIATTFVLESAFIALMGILSGVVGGMIIARNLLTSGQFSDQGVGFTVPWVEVLLVAGTAFVFSMFMTWWPSRQAARVPVADALRYE